MFIKTRKKGFTLVEIALVLAIATIIGFVAFSQLIKNQEVNKAHFAGAQIKQIGDAVNAYISNHYDTISTLTNSAGSSSDMGPRTCSTSTSSCNITVTTLVNEGILPASYTGQNVYGHGYNIILKRTGTAPYYKVNGLSTTDNSLKIGNNIRYDLLGMAMLTAGIDSGMTRDSSSVVSGFNGSWSENFSNYSNISKTGLLAYQSGYGTYNYSVFLRRDGTLPMTGNLNMGSNSITNAINYTGSGDISTGGTVVAGSTITAGGEITAKNGYGDNITIGGDAAGGDYEIRLATSKPLSIFSPSIPSADRATTTVFQTNGQMKVIGNNLVSGNIATNNLSATDMPTGWSGIRTGDVAAGGTLAALKEGTNGTAGQFAAYMNKYGNIYASNQITTAGTITASGNIETGEYLKFTNAVIAGYACSTVGLVSRDSAGQLLTCKAGVWTPEQPVGIPQPWPSTTPPAGWLVCNGQTFSTTAYPLLAKAYPSGKLPDLRGNYIRGLDQGRGYDSEPSRTVLSEQTDTIQNHSHSLPTSLGWVGYKKGDTSIDAIFPDNNSAIASTGNDPNDIVKNGNNQNPTSGSVLRTYDLNYSVSSTPYSTTPRYSAETRTKNVSFVYIVRAL